MTAFPPLSDFAEPSTHYCRKDPDWSSFDLKGVAHWVGIDSFSAPAPLVGAGIARRKTSVLLNAHRWGVARAEEIGECTGLCDGGQRDPLLGRPKKREEARWDGLRVNLRVEGASARTDSGRRSCALRGS